MMFSVSSIMSAQRSNKRLAPWYLIVGFLAASVMVTLAASYIIGKTPYGLYLMAGMAGGLFAMLIFFRPKYGAYMLVVFIYANLSDVLGDTFGIPDTNKAWVALTLLGLVAHYTVTGRDTKIIFRSKEALIFLYTVTSLASIFLAADHPDTINVSVDIIKEFIIIFIIVQLCSDEKIFKIAIWLMIGSAVVLSILSLYQVVTGNYNQAFFGLALNTVQEIAEDASASRVMGPVDDPNYYAMALLPVFIIAAYRSIYQPDRIIRAVGLGAALIILAAIVFTYSRGAIVAMAGVGAIIVLRGRVEMSKILTLGIVLLVVVLTIFPASFFDRLAALPSVLTTDPSRQTEDSLRGRSSEMIVAAEMFYDYPVLGIGRGVYESRYLEYASELGLDNRGEARQAHSLYFEAAAEQGILGLGALIGMVIVLWSGLNTARHTLMDIGREDLEPWINGVQLGLAGYLFASIFLHDDYIRYLSLIIAFGAAGSAMTEQLAVEYQASKIEQQKATGPLNEMSLSSVEAKGELT